MKQPNKIALLAKIAIQRARNNYDVLRAIVEEYEGTEYTRMRIGTTVALSICGNYVATDEGFDITKKVEDCRRNEDITIKIVLDTSTRLFNDTICFQPFPVIKFFSSPEKVESVELQNIRYVELISSVDKDRTVTIMLDRVCFNVIDEDSPEKPLPLGDYATAFIELESSPTKH